MFRFCVQDCRFIFKQYLSKLILVVFNFVYWIKCYLCCCTKCPSNKWNVLYAAQLVPVPSPSSIKIILISDIRYWIFLIKLFAFIFCMYSFTPIIDVENISVVNNGLFYRLLARLCLGPTWTQTDPLRWARKWPQTCLHTLENAPARPTAAWRRWIKTWP